jgi:hypothetical protein
VLIFEGGVAFKVSSQKREDLAEVLDRQLFVQIALSWDVRTMLTHKPVLLKKRPENAV